MSPPICSISFGIEPRPNSKLNVPFILLSSPPPIVLSLSLPHLLCFSLSFSLSLALSLSVCLPLADSVFVAVASRRCDRMKYCPEGRYNFDAFTTFRVLVIIGSLCLEVSFMIAFLFSCLGFFSSALCWLLCYVLLIVELV